MEQLCQESGSNDLARFIFTNMRQQMAHAVTLEVQEATHAHQLQVSLQLRDMVHEHQCLEAFFNAFYYHVLDLDEQVQATVWGCVVDRKNYPTFSQINTIISKTQARPAVSEVYRARVPGGDLVWPSVDIPHLLYGTLSDEVHVPNAKTIYVPDDATSPLKELFNKLATWSQKTVTTYRPDRAAFANESAMKA
eukprot:1584729-Amphidinium_carterae.2